MRYKKHANLTVLQRRGKSEAGAITIQRVTRVISLAKSSVYR